MLLGNLKSKIQRVGVFRLMRNFSNFLKITSGRTLEFPLNFSGLSMGDSDKHSIFDTALTQLYEINIHDGFKLAYKSTLEAIVSKDEDFLREICEPGLYEEFAKGFENLEKAGVTLGGDNFDTEDITFVINSFTMIFGVDHDRRENKPASQYTIRDMNFNGIDMKFYQARSIDPSQLMKLYPFIQVGCTFNSPINIVAKNSEGKPIAGLNSTNNHKFLFESVNEKKEDGISHIQNMAKSMAGIFGGLSMMGNPKAAKNFIQQFFVVKDMAWKVVDVDDHLDGNKFTT